MNNEVDQQNDYIGNEEKHSDDEIDLLQLFLVLNKRKYLILISFLLSLGLGVAYSLLTPPKYNYSTTLEIGSLTKQNSETGEIVKELIESPQMVLAKTNQNHIPLAQLQVANKTAGRILGVTASIPKNSQLVVLVSKGAENDSAIFKELHEHVVNPLLESHQAVVSVSKKTHDIMIDSANQNLENLKDPRVYAIEEKALKLKLNAANMALIEYDDQENLYLSNLKQLSETESLLKRQIEKIEESLALAFASQPKALSEAGDETRAMTLLLINNQIQQSENRLAALQERLNVGVESERKELEKNIADNKRGKELQAAKIDELQSQLINLRVQRDRQVADQENVIALLKNNLKSIHESQTLGLAVQSPRPNGPGKMVILALSGLLGLIGGVLLIFFVELMNAARQRLDVESRSSE